MMIEEPKSSPVEWTPHPLIPIPSEDQIREVLARPNGEEELAEYYVRRENAIRLSKDDPYNYGCDPEHWAHADELLALRIMFLIVFGGNRAGKSEYAAKRVVQSGIANPGSVIFCLHENERAAIGMQHKYIWRYLPPELKALNGKQDSVFKIKYSQAGGFTEGKLVFPNTTEIYFLTYHQKPNDFEGMEIGAPTKPGLAVWADENMPMPWFQMLKLRMVSRSGQMIWTYTPVNGMTPVIKEILGKTPKTIKARPSELLPDRVNVKGCPPGTMPYIQIPFQKSCRVIYFHSILNPFGGHYKNIVTLCQGKSSEYVERRAYGYSRDVGNVALPNFGDWNIVEPDQLPEKGTNYCYTDPAGNRAWATIWVRVVPGNPPRYYIYRDWPPEQEYGEWAVPTERNPTEEQRKGWDGDMGPAQKTLGYGIAQYKREFLKRETVNLKVENGKILEVDPYRKNLVKPILLNQGYEIDEGSGLVICPSTKQPLSRWSSDVEAREYIYLRGIDPRAGRGAKTAEQGGTCIIDEMLRDSFDPVTNKIFGPMHWRPASGVGIDDGLVQLNDLLCFNLDEPLCPIINEPKLYVSSDCRQVIWAMANYTGLGGDKGACKDFIDLLRYMAMDELQYMDSGPVKTKGRGSY